MTSPPARPSAPLVAGSRAPVPDAPIDTITEPARDLPVTRAVDVIVGGGGIAGIFAALAAARRGARAVMVERLSVPGGNYGPGLGARHDLWQHPALESRGLGGVVGAFLARLASLGGTGRFAFTGGGDSKNWSWPGIHDFPVIDNEAFMYLGLKMLREAGVDIIVNTSVAGVLMAGDRLGGLIVENRSGRQALTAPVVIDTTGDAEIAHHAGAPCTHEGAYGTGLFFQVEGVDWPTFERFRAEGSARPLDAEDEAWFEDVFVPALGGWRWRNAPRFMLPQIRRAWEVGEYQYVQDVEGICKCYMVPFGTHGQDLATVEACPQSALDPLDATHMSAAETRFRMYAYETVRFMHDHVPGFERARIRQMAGFLGSRHSRRIVAEHALDEEDVWSGRRFPDVVHRLTTLHTREGTLVDMRNRQEGVVHELPYRQLLPRNVDGLLAAGRAIQTNRISRLRGRWIVMLSGAISGVAAALCARGGVTPRQLDVRALQRQLVEEGYFLGDEERLAELNL